MNSMHSHVVTAVAAALFGAVVAYASVARSAEAAQPEVAQAQAAQTLLFETTMDDVLGRRAAVRVLERGPGSAGVPHRHPGSHTFGYVLEGTYEVQVDDGPIQRLGPGQTFYEYPGALHAVSRNASSTESVRYLVFTVSDPTLPATVPEP